MEGKISKYLLRSICLFVGVFIVSESLWACSYEDDILELMRSSA